MSSEHALAPQPEASAVNGGPLAGVRVIELGMLLAGPFTGRLLGDMGAEIVKIEPPGQPDPLRDWGKARYEGRSLWWPVQSRNKMCCTLNLRVERGQELLEAMLEVDEGARRAGEFAFGLNPAVGVFTRNILFDEKIGGTVHVALGSSFKHLGGRNESGLHWDLVCDLRADGEVYADGDLIWRNGAFVRDAEPAETSRA